MGEDEFWGRLEYRVSREFRGFPGQPARPEKITVDRGDRIWGGDWRAKIRARLHAQGWESVGEFLAKFPGEAYTTVAKRLGDDVAAFQLEWMQFEATHEDSDIRLLAMDSLVRDFKFHLPGGWRHEARDDFDTAGVHADWIVRLENHQAKLKGKAQTVWAALEALNPPVGWSPTGPQDALIVAAFESGWPEA